MKKFIIAYICFWLPAVLVAFLFNNEEMASQILQWFFASVMVIGWATVTGISAYFYPRTTLSLIFFYTGATVLVVTLKYSTTGGTALHSFMRTWGGVFSYKPLEVVVRALHDFNIPHELYVMGFVILLCIFGYLIGLLYRRVKPNPYRPRILSK